MRPSRVLALAFVTTLTLACEALRGSDVGISSSENSPTEGDGSVVSGSGSAAAAASSAASGTLTVPVSSSSSPPPPPVDAGEDAAEYAPYTCDAPPAQCALSCSEPSCTQVCDAESPTDCHWECAPPTCACGDGPTASCTLNEPTAVCDVKCEKPDCEILCPECATEACAPCATQCKQVHCVTHCQAPKITTADGGHRFVHCQAPKPSCETVCEPAACTRQRTPACPEDGGDCPAIEGWETVCEPPKCHVTCDPPPPAACTVSGCDESCEPLGPCTEQCATPTCTLDADTGIVTCDAPTECVPSCSGGACHVTSCD